MFKFYNINLIYIYTQFACSVKFNTTHEFTCIKPIMTNASKQSRLIESDEMKKEKKKKKFQTILNVLLFT